MREIGVIGAGTIGSSLAQNLAQAGYKVLLIDICDTILEESRRKITEGLRMYRLVKKDKTVNSKEILERIVFTKDYSVLREAEFIVENVTENWDVKKDVYIKLDDICNDDCIYAVNTSAISITKVASNTKRQAQVIGMHFMNPVPLKQTVEVIRGYHTSEDTIEKSKSFLKSIGKEAIIVNDSPGFVSNRISHLFMNEAAFVVYEQVAKPRDVDNIFRNCFSHKMGPLETADLIGLDTVMNTLDVLFESYNDPKFRCCPLIRKMVHAGMCGVKSGKGFYEYN